MRAREATVETSLALAVVALSVVTVVLLLDPDLQFVGIAPQLDVVINTSNTLVAIGVGALAWSRWRETRLTTHYQEAGAFIVLSLAGLVFVAVLVTGADGTVGMSLADPNQVPLYLRALSRLIAGVLLLAAARSSGLSIDEGRARILVPALAVCYLVSAAAIIEAGDSLPELINSEGLARLRVDPEVPSQLPGVTGLGALVYITSAGLFLWAAALIGGRSTPSGIRRRPYLAIGLVFGAFSEIHTAIYPGTYTSLVTTADFLRLAFYAILLVGIYAEVRADLRDLREANAELARLRPTELASATLEERARLAREIHDGVAQELWLARLKAGQLESDPTLDGNARTTLGELIIAIEAGLAETSHAVLALRARVDRPGIVPVLEEYTAEFTARFGIAVQVEASQSVPLLDARSEAESLRIVQEALNNARKHADATLVRVILEARDSSVRIMVIDNGQGFQSDEPSGGFGLRSMAERARQIGGRLDVRSEPSDGTWVTLDVPTSSSSPDG